jgi:signal transduction histidine kinase
MLAEYISDKRQDFDQSVSSAIDDAVRATSLGRDLISLLEEIGLAPTTDTPDVGNRARRESTALRRWVAGHMHNSEPRQSIELMNKLEDLKDLCGEIEKVLKSQLVKPVELVKLAVERFLRNVPPELAGVDLEIEFKSDLSNSVVIIVHQTLFRDILRNLLHNLRHAIDPSTRRVKAEFAVFRTSPSVESLVFVRVKCGTRGVTPTAIAADRSTTQRLASEAEPYGVECIPPDPQSEAPWTETWAFWSL